MVSLDTADQDDFGYDLSVEDEELLASLADQQSHPPAEPVTHTPQARPQRHDAASTSCSSPRRMAAIVGVGRTHSVTDFIRRTRPDPTPAAVPADRVQYPDCRCPASCLWMGVGESVCGEEKTVLTDLEGSSEQNLDERCTRRTAIHHCRGRARPRHTCPEGHARADTPLPNFS